MIERLSEPVIDPPFFYSVDPTFSTDPRTQAIIKDREDDRLQPVYITGFDRYPPGYEAMQFKIINRTRLFCRKLRLVLPEGGYWIITEEWARPDTDAETHYRKCLLHMDFPQIIKYEESMDYERDREYAEYREKMHRELHEAEAEREAANRPLPSNPWE